MRRFFASLLVLGLLSSTAVLLEQETAFAQKEKEPKKPDPKKEDSKKEEMKKEDGLKDQWPKVTDGTVVKIVKVDVEKKTVEVEDGAGKKSSLTVTADTKFFGPQGGKSEDKIKDDRFVGGYTAKIITDKAGKSLTEVYLAYRIIKKDDKKDKDDKKEEMKEDPKKKSDDKKKEEPKKKP